MYEVQSNLSAINFISRKNFSVQPGLANLTRVEKKLTRVKFIFALNDIIFFKSNDLIID